MRGFFDMIRSDGMIPSWESRKKSEEYKRISEIIPGSPGSRGVRAQVPGLPPDIPEQVLLSSFSTINGRIYAARRVVADDQEVPRTGEAGAGGGTFSRSGLEAIS
jgi:hypothetical protein